MTRFPRALVLPLAVLAAAAAGCGGGDGLPRQSVSGKVTFGGQPLEKGTIQFVPDDPNMKDPTSGGAPILDGSYAIGSEMGLVPGKYKVSISSPTGGAAQGDAPGSASAMPKELIPSQYNTASTLSADVKAGQSNTFDFPLEK